MQSHQLKIASLPSLPKITIVQYKKARRFRRALVEIVGVEPTTPCLQSRCSSQLSYTPVCIADVKMQLFFESAKKIVAFIRISA